MSLEKGHIADMYHAGTRRYYRVSVIQETYPFEQEPETSFGGIAGGGGAPRQLRVSPEPNYHLKCIEWLRSQGGGAALNSIVEEGYDGDGVDYKSLYEGWTAPVSQADGCACNEGE